VCVRAQLLLQEKGALDLLFDARLVAATAPVAATSPDGMARNRADVDAEVTAVIQGTFPHSQRAVFICESLVALPACTCGVVYFPVDDRWTFYIFFPSFKV
jgi:hypothetical protein